MKLSMRMIANRLTDLMDITCSIDENDKPVLRSARMAYAPDCVYVFASGEDVIYQGESGRITIPGISLLEGFEILQGVFDDFREWEEKVCEALEHQKYQKAIDLSRPFFRNPMFLLDGNRMVLGISREDDDSGMDEEWRYLCEHRHSSLESARLLHLETEVVGRMGENARIHCITPSGKMRYGGISCSLYSENIEIGRFSILDVNHSLNRGDIQLANCLCEMLESTISRDRSVSKSLGKNFFYSILFGGHWREDELDLQLAFQGWKREDVFQIVLLQPEENRNIEVSLQMMMHAMIRQLPECIVLRQSPYIVIIANWEILRDSLFHSILHSYASGTALRTGFSLPVTGILALPHLFRQADSALRFAEKRKSEARMCFFRDIACAYLLKEPDMNEKLWAVHPAVRKLWQLHLNEGDERFETLKIFLDTERSYTQTAALMHAHRNTVLYRVKKAEEVLNENLDQVNIRMYIRLSMALLEIDWQEKLSGK